MTRYTAPVILTGHQPAPPQPAIASAWMNAKAHRGHPMTFDALDRAEAATPLPRACLLALRLQKPMRPRRLIAQGAYA